MTKQMKALHALSSFVPKLDIIEASVKSYKTFKVVTTFLYITEMFETL